MFTKIRRYTALSVFAFLLACQTDDDGANAPAADFVAAANGDYTLEIEFRNTSQHAVAYVWDFGDNTTSTEENPTHTYTRGGNYTITLIAAGNNAKVDTLTRALDVKAVDACAARQLEKELAALDAYLAAKISLRKSARRAYAMSFIKWATAPSPPLAALSTSTMLCLFRWILINGCSTRATYTNALIS